MRSNMLVWLWCMWRARRAYTRAGGMFSSGKFLDDLRPFLSPAEYERITYPHAIFWVTPKDVRRALRMSHDRL